MTDAQAAIDLALTYIAGENPGLAYADGEQIGGLIRVIEWHYGVDFDPDDSKEVSKEKEESRAALPQQAKEALAILTYLHDAQAEYEAF